VVPTTDGAGSLILAERIRQSIEQAPIETDAGPVEVTASCGVASNSCTNRLSPTALLKLADDALYQAKALGRNRCQLADVADASPIQAPLAGEARVTTKL
jgi:diguanylate cyclase (GGDEF)-like protein